MSVKTTDVDVYIGTASSLLPLTDITGLAVNGTSTVTNEARLGTRDEEASVHAAGVSISIDTLYDGTAVAALRGLAGSASNIAIINERGFECYPIDIPDLPQSVSPVTPVTSAFTMGQSGRGRYGTSTPPQGTLENGAASDTVNTTGASSVHVIVTRLSATPPTTFTIGRSGNGNFSNIPIALGIHRVALPSGARHASASIQINDASNRELDYILLIGSDQPVASG